MVRKPRVAGSFYPANRQKLEEQIKSCFGSDLGPRKLPGQTSKDKTESLSGIIVPHAGYIYSGPIAAWAYLEAAKANPAPKIIILIGPNHTGRGAAVSIYPDGSWLTPLGSIAVNEVLSQRIAEEGFALDSLAHEYEHSLEVQLPFLQFIFGSGGYLSALDESENSEGGSPGKTQRRRVAKATRRSRNTAGSRHTEFAAGAERLDSPPFQIMAIALLDQSLNTALKLAESLAKVLAGEKDFLVVASSDLTHYETADVAEQKDSKILQALQSGDIANIYDTAAGIQASACGLGPVSVAIKTCSLLGADKIKLLKYETSAAVTHDRQAVVGYSSLSIER